MSYNVGAKAQLRAMIYSVIINLGIGNLNEGFPVVTASLLSENNPRPQKLSGHLPPAPNFIQLYRNWQLMYGNLCDRLATSSLRNFDDDDELEIDEADVTNISTVDFEDLCEHLQLDINNWLESPGIMNISRKLRSLLNPADEIQIVIETQDTLIQKLPWHCCSFFEDYPRAEVSFARTEYRRTPDLEISKSTRNKVRILAILGNSQGIDLEQERRFLQSLPDTEVELLVKPSRQEFNHKLWDAQGWDMLFFAGHSETKEETGIIYINENPTNNSLTIEQLTEALKAAIEKGLKVAIFNSCDGLGLAHSLEKLHIPTTIVMREPVPNRVAEEFFNYFLQAFAFDKKSLYISVHEARRKLQGLEDDFPGASWLPVIFINPAEEIPTWSDLQKKCDDKSEFAVLPSELLDYQLDNIREKEYSGNNIKKRRDWGEAIDVSTFYGRDDEVKTLKKWIMTDNCRLINIIGMGGIGKTALSVKLAELVEHKFDFLIWRSLRNAPSLTELLKDLIGFLSESHQISIADSVDKQISQLIDCLRAARCLVVLDNLESILDSDKKVGSYREGYEKYGQLLRCVGDTKHQSCFLITSREKPKGFSERSGDNLPVRMLTLKGLNSQDGQSILAQKGLSLSEREINSLVDFYAGNPLALKIAATTVEETFDGDVADFLNSDTVIFGDIFDLLDQQFKRLSILENQVMYWLAINREKLSIKDLQNDMVGFSKTRELITALESLQWRCLIENNSGKLTQQPVVMEYVIEELIEQVAEELYSGEIGIINQYALIKAQSQDYIRNAQIQFILKPIADKLFTFWTNKPTIQNYLNQFLSQLKSAAFPQPGYAAGNIINLLRQLDIELNNYDFSNLTICQANFSGINLQQTNFANSDLSKSVFTQTLGSIFAAKFSPTGNLFATGIDNQINLWEVNKTRQLRTLSGHTDWVESIAFSSDGKILASGSYDKTVRLWNVENGEYLRILTGHTLPIKSVAFHRHGSILASGSNDKTIRLWNIQTGECSNILQGHENNIIFLSFHPDDEKLISASNDNTVRLWNIQTGECLQVFNISVNWLLAIALSHDGKTLVTGSGGNTVKFWNISNGECIKTLPNYQSKVWTVAFSKNDEQIVTGSEDNSIKIWDVQTGECLQTLQEHHQRVWLVDLNPDDKTLISISEDQTIKLWDIPSRRCLKTLVGYSNWILSLGFSPDGHTLASSSQDGQVRLWNVTTGMCNLTLKGHTNLVSSLAFAPLHMQNCLLASGSDDNTIKIWNHQGQCLKTLIEHQDWVYSVAFTQGETLASCSRDNTIKIWNCLSGRCLYTFAGHQKTVKSISFNPDGDILASASDDKTVKIWDVNTGKCLQTCEGHQDRLDCVVFSPSGGIIASAGCDKVIKIWDVNTGKCLHSLQAHNNRIRKVVFSPDGKILASCSDDKTIKIWNSNTGENISIFSGHDKAVWAIAISPDNSILASGGEDETIKLWHLQTGELMQTWRCFRPYEGMNIYNTTGLTDAQKMILKSLGADFGNG
ncbi:MAG: CHAT domain-containing protein [Cyanobacteria bacterium J06573_2]